MSKKDSIKAQITLLQVFFAVITSSELVLIGWLATEQGGKAMMLIGSAAMAVALGTGMVITSNAILHRIDKLEEL